MNISLYQWGNSLGICLPKHILDKYELVIGSSLEILERENGILLRKVQDINLSDIIASYSDEDQIEEVFNNSLASEDWELEENE